MARYTRPEVLKISCKTQYFRVFHSNGHENCMYLMNFLHLSVLFDFAVKAILHYKKFEMKKELNMFFMFSGTKNPRSSQEKS